MQGFLYFVGQGGGIPLERPFADQVLGYMFGLSQVIIDPEKLFHHSEDRFPLCLRSLDEARRHPWLSGLRWVYLSAQGKLSLQEYEHPEDDVLYCLGADGYGFGEDVSALETVRVYAPDPDEPHPTREFFAATLIPIVAYDRAFKLWRRRRSSTT